MLIPYSSRGLKPTIMSCCAMGGAVTDVEGCTIESGAEGRTLEGGKNEANCHILAD